jgi:trehalose synthase
LASLIDVKSSKTLADYELVPHLAPAVASLRAETTRLAKRFAGRTLYMVNSTSQGGGVAEMLPTMISMLRELGIATEWVVIDTDVQPFFALTKRLHNLIHGLGDGELDADARALYEEVNRANAGFLVDRMRDGDILVVHDPQPMALAGMVKEHRQVQAVWRCHIGLDDQTPQTRAAWAFLEAYHQAYDRAVFSAPEYIPSFFAQRTTLIYPAIDPLAAKSRDLQLHELVSILANAALTSISSPVVQMPFLQQALRLQRNGRWSSASLGEEIGLLSRPVITQVSRWDHLKGFLPLMAAFAQFKYKLVRPLDAVDPLHRRRIKLARLVLAGPDPSSVADDPEGRAVLDQLTEAYLRIDPAIQDDIALITLPMQDRDENALMVNALQRSSTIIVQNSLREGFGLTVTEAMWKRIPILSNSRACGPRHQVRDTLDGRMIDDPEDSGALADMMDEMLGDPRQREHWGANGQRRAHEYFLVFSQLTSWVRMLSELVDGRSAP